MLDSRVIYRLIFVFFFWIIGVAAHAQVDSLWIQEGTASYYGKKFQGRRTSSGEIFHLDSMTAAHKNLPFGTWVRVTNRKNGLSVLVRINDRLPSYSKRDIDISWAAAGEIDMIRDGLAKVRIEAANLDELDSLIGYFEEREKLGLRLRPYERSVLLPSRKPDLALKKIKPGFPSDFLK